MPGCLPHGHTRGRTGRCSGMEDPKHDESRRPPPDDHGFNGGIKEDALPTISHEEEEDHDYSAGEIHQGVEHPESISTDRRGEMGRETRLDDGAQLQVDIQDKECAGTNAGTPEAASKCGSGSQKMEVCSGPRKSKLKARQRTMEMMECHSGRGSDSDSGDSGEDVVVSDLESVLSEDEASEEKKLPVGSKKILSISAGHYHRKTSSTKGLEQHETTQQESGSATCLEQDRDVDHVVDDDRNNTGKHLCSCHLCDKTYTNHHALRLHKNLVHKVGAAESFQCHFCLKNFSLKSTLMQHMQVHTVGKPHKCSTCPMEFSDRSTLVEHERVHTGERPYACDICGKTFAWLVGLQSHKSFIHNKDRIFQCDLCPKTFGEYELLAKHKQTHTREKGKKIFTCHVCMKVYADYKNFRKHLSQKHGSQDCGSIDLPI